MKKLLLYSLFTFPFLAGAQNLFPEFESTTLVIGPPTGAWGVANADNAMSVTIVDDGVNTSNKFVQMAGVPAGQRDLRISYLLKAGITYRLSADVKVASTTSLLETFFNIRTTSFTGTIAAFYIAASNGNTDAVIDAELKKMAVPAAKLTTEFKEVYASLKSDIEQTGYFRFNRNANATNYFYDNIQLKVLDCANETIELLPTGTSAVSIYANDINNGVAIAIGTNATVSGVTFFEANGITNADAKFTLGTDGTITSTGGVADTDYKIQYTLTSTVDADGSGTNDTDTITQTFSVKSTLSVNKLEKSTFSFYPNPANNDINISSQEEIKSVTLLNLLGQEVLSTKVNAKKYTFNVNNLSKNTYIMKVVIGNTTKFEKVVIQ